MPLIVKDFSWHQTPETVSISVTIKGIKARLTDILTSNKYIRIHCHPYIFEAFLSGEVDYVRGSCTIDQESNVVSIQLPKVNAGQEWVFLENKELDRMKKKEIRETAVSNLHKRREDQAQARAAIRQEQKRLSIREQIRLDNKERQRIVDIKKSESNRALEDMKQWISKSEMVEGHTVVSQTKPTDSPKHTKVDPIFEDRFAEGDSVKVERLMEDRGIELKKPSVSVPSSDDKNEYDDDGSNSIVVLPKPVNKEVTKYIESKDIWQEEDLGQKHGQLNDRQEGQNFPEIREEAQIFVEFTPRKFPTPARESNVLEEEEWLKKQVEARHHSGFNDADLRPEERDPSWLLDKGISLMKTGCHMGAVSALCLGIKLAPKMPELYVERASAQLALRNFVKTVEDASQALELLTPKVVANAGNRLKCHVTRANGFQALKMNREAVMDLKEAVSLDPDNLKFHKQIDNIQKEFCDESSSSDED